MATYVVGDVQGCARELEKLLQHIGFGADDHLWLLGDLVNRGPDSARVMAMVYALQRQCTVVLGNHDLHFLAAHFAGHSLGSNDTMGDLLDAPQASQYAEWLCRQKLLHWDKTLNVAMAHAGVPHIWSMHQAVELAGEVEDVLLDQHRDVSRAEFFKHMYGNKPDCWQADLTGLDRVKLITNYFTRMRLIDDDGTLDFSHKGALADAPAGWTPWYQLTAPCLGHTTLLFGHWASLDGITGYENLLALDTGCVYGRALTAFCIETGQYYRVPGYDKTSSQG